MHRLGLQGSRLAFKYAHTIKGPYTVPIPIAKPATPALPIAVAKNVPNAIKGNLIIKNTTAHAPAFFPSLANLASIPKVKTPNPLTANPIPKPIRPSRPIIGHKTDAATKSKTADQPNAERISDQDSGFISRLQGGEQPRRTTQNQP